MRIALIGFGVVGQGLAALLQETASDLSQRYDFQAEVVAVATNSRGTLYHPDGLDLEQLLAAIQTGHLDAYPDVFGLNRNWDVSTLIRQSNADVMVEVSPSNLQTGQPALAYCSMALENGKHVVLANKGPLMVAYPDLAAQAQAAGRRLRFEATIMAGTPSIRLAQSALAGCHISEARGILNGTTNFILTQMETGMSYSAALYEAQRLGYAEPDPTADVEGHDAAAKVCILGGILFGRRYRPEELDVRGISAISAGDVRMAQAAGERWKLIAQVTAKGGSVQPVRMPLSNPLAGVSGATNAITYTTDLLGDVTLVGPGAGQRATGFGLLSDLLELHGLGSA